MRAEVGRCMSRETDRVTKPAKRATSCGPRRRLLSRSMKGDVKRKFFPWTERPRFSRHPAPVILWTRCVNESAGRDPKISGRRRAHFSGAGDFIWPDDRGRCLRRDKQKGCAMPTRVLSATRGLRLYGVIRGRLEWVRRLAPSTETWPNGSPETALEPERPPNLPTARPSLAIRKGADAQAACAFRYWALNRSPFFQRVQTRQAILRARVRRASSGFIP